MKRKVLTVLVALATLVVVGCGKEKQCICYYEDVDSYYEKTIFIGPGLNCSDITEVSFEERITTEEGEHTLQRTDIHTAHCRDAHNI